MVEYAAVVSEMRSLVFSDYWPRLESRSEPSQRVQSLCYSSTDPIGDIFEPVAQWCFGKDL